MDLLKLLSSNCLAGTCAKGFTVPSIGSLLIFRGSNFLSIASLFASKGIALVSFSTILVIDFEL